MSINCSIATIKFSLYFQQIVRTLFFQYFMVDNEQYRQKDDKENPPN